MTSKLKEVTGDAFDQTFISEMTAHHNVAIEIAQIAHRNAKHPEIKVMAQNIIAAQEEENKQLMKWEQQWYGSTAS
jgi:uncharacterized protein (DUF305 family)